MMQHQRNLYRHSHLEGRSSYRIIASFLCIGLLTGCNTTNLLSSSDCPVASAPITAKRLNIPSLGSLNPAPVKFELAFSNAEIERLNSLFLETVPLTKATVASVTIARSGGGSWSSTFGMPSEDHKSFWWASVGKLVTATIILQLVDEGYLSLDQKIDRWFPYYPGSDRITVDQLLTHTSGVFTYNYDKQFREDEGYRSPEQLIAIAAKHGQDFCPGTQWHYSNTGYLMLGVIAEQLEDSSIAEIVERRIARPLGLKSLRMVDRDSDPETVVPFKGQDALDSHIEVISSIAGAGGIAADPDDMIRVLQAWISGPLLKTKSRDYALSDLFPMFSTNTGYGRGVMVISVPDTAYPTTWLGHTGGSPDAKGVLVYDLKRDTYVAVALNTGGEGEALANVLLKALDGP